MNVLKKRAFISIFFKDSISKSRMRGYLTVSFDQDSLLYQKCKKLGAPGIRKLIGIESYRELVDKSKKEGRSLGNYIKFKLQARLGCFDE